MLQFSDDFLLHFKTCKTNVLLNHVISLSLDRIVMCDSVTNMKMFLAGGSF